MNPMIKRCGIDTSILARLATGASEDGFKRGMVSPLNGRPVFEALAAERGCGLLDRRIAGDYRRAELITLTLDRRMASLLDVQAL
jgi:hypothetical protein